MLTSRSTGRAASASRASTVASCVAVGQVGGQHLDLDAVRRAQLGGDVLQPGLVAGDEHQVVAPVGELVGEGAADAGGRAGDEGGLGHGASQTGACAISAPRSGMMGRDDAPTLAIANQKGGVAKTTTVASIGAALAELGHPVLLVDLDPQACLTFSLGIDPEDLELSVHHVLTKGLDPGRGDPRDRGRRRPAAGHDRAGPRRGRPAHPHRPRARPQDVVETSRRAARRTTGSCSTARPRWACSPSPR